MIVLLVIVFLLIFLILFLNIAKGMEKRKQLEAEERTIRAVQLRENPGWYVKQTLKKQHPSQFEESLGKIHPENMAMLIRKLIMEDQSTVQEDITRQKLAVLLVTMGSKTCSELFKYLQKDELDTIAAELEQLEDPDSDQVKSILLEFHDLMVIFLERKKE